MAATFPAFLRTELADDGAFPSFIGGINRAADHAERKFNDAFASVRRAAESALSGQGGSGAFAFDASAARQAATAAEQQATRLRQAAIAAGQLSNENRDLTASTQRYLQATGAAANAAEQEAREQRELATVLELVEQRVRENAAAMGLSVAAANNNTVAISRAGQASGAMRAGSQQLSFQIQDVAQQFALGTSATTIFAQQAGQTISAIQLLTSGGAAATGTFGRLFGFLGGPWGAVIVGATTIATAFGSSLFGVERAADVARLGLYGTADAAETVAERMERVIDRLRSISQASLATGQLELGAADREVARLQGNASTLSRAEALARRQSNYTYEEFQRFRPVSANPESFLQFRIDRAVAADRYREALGTTRRDIVRIAGAANAARSQIEGEERQEAYAEGQRSRSTGSNGSASRGESSGAESSARDAARETERLQAVAERAAEQIGRIRQGFIETPSAIQRANDATRELDRLLAELAEESNLPNIAALRAEIEGLKPAIEASMTAPLRDTLEAQAEQLAISQLVLAGREDEADVMREQLRLRGEMRGLEDDEMATIRSNLDAQRRLNELIAQREELLTRYADQVADVRGALIDIVANPLDIGETIGGLAQSLSRRSAEHFVDSQFGGVFRALNESFASRSPLAEAERIAAGAMDRAQRQIADLGIEAVDATGATRNATQAVNDFGAAVRGATGAVTGNPASGAPAPLADAAKGFSDLSKGIADTVKQAANDNPYGPIVVTGTPYTWEREELASVRGAIGELAGTVAPLIRTAWQRPPNAALDAMGAGMAPVDVANIIGGKVGESIAGPLGRAIGENLGTFLQGAGYGQMAGGLLLGQSGNNLGASIGGALGNKFGEEVLGPAIGSALGETLGSLGGPIGSIAGGIIGSKLFSAIMGTPKASATLSLGDYGLVSSVSGSKSLQGAASGLGGSVIDGLERIVEQLGGVLEGAINVSIGVRGDNYRVDPTGRGNTKESKGAIDFGEDQEAAVLYAIQDAIRDGIIVGLRQSTLNLIQGGGDLAGQLSKASRWEDAMDQVAQLADPVAFALKSVNEEFEALIKIGREAGATVEEMAGLEMLYNERRKEALEEAAEQLTGSLKDLLADLTVNNDARSLRSRLGMAMGDLSPFLASIGSGEAVDWEAYSEAARLALDLQRQVSGSGEGYFALLDQVTNATRDALADQENVIALAQGGDNPFGASDGSSRVVNAIDALGDRLVAEFQAQHTNMGTLIRTGGGGGAAAQVRALDRMDF